MEDNFETLIRKIVHDELSKRADTDLVSITKFCKDKDISRVTLWRAEKDGKVKLTRIGKRVFLNPNQFVR